MRLAENAFKAAERGSKLTAQLLAFSRTQKLATEPVDLNRLIEGMRELLNQSLGANVTIETESRCRACPSCIADANQLEVGILNLAHQRARRDAGRRNADDHDAHADPGRPHGVVSRSTDTGTGMPPEVIARAFDPFFTTKPPGKGTGLGLSQVYGLVRQMGGDVDIKSEVGKGTSNPAVYLRRGHVAPASWLPRRSSVSGGGTAERILVVDDDHDVRAIMTSFLAEIGYVVHEAEHGEAALAMQKSVNPQLMIIDFAMPGTNGAEVVKAARAAQPNAADPVRQRLCRIQPRSKPQWVRRRFSASRSGRPNWQRRSEQRLRAINRPLRMSSPTSFGRRRHQDVLACTLV